MLRPALLVSTAALLTLSPALAQTPDALVLKRVQLSTGGVGSFEYEARVTGDAALTLEVRRDQVDDVLKSVVVYDDRGGVGTIDLPGAEPLDTAFRELPFSRDDLTSPAALLTALKGAEVETDGARALTGRVLSVTEETAQTTFTGANSAGGATITRHRLSLMTASGVRQLILEDTDALRFTDPRVQAQVNAALAAIADNARRERRRLTVRSLANGAEGERTVRVAFVAATPLWKATYRLSLPAVGASNKTNGQGQTNGQATQAQGGLQGWAVLENLSGEDWRDVSLSVVSGNPVTLRQALYTPYSVERPEVPVEVLGRVLPTSDEGGVALDRGRGLSAAESARPAPVAMAAPPPPAMAAPMAAPMAKAAPFAAAPPPPLASASVTSAEATAADTSTQVLFRYPQPVTLANGGTLMMPIADRALPVERIALYQPNTQPRHPLAALRLRNDSQTALPPGLLTFYETVNNAPTHVGDARMATLPVGESRLLSFAVDSAVTIDRADQPSRHLTRATAADGVMLLTVSDRQTSVYTVAGARDGDRKLVIEHPRRPGWTLVEPKDGEPKTGTGAEPVDTTATAHRLTLAVPAGQTVTLAVSTERPRQERIVLGDLSADQLTAQASAQELPAALRDGLKALAALRAAVADKERRIADIEREQQDRVAEQERLRANLAALPNGSDLHKRTLAKMGEAENRLDALGRDLTTARAEAESARATLRERVRSLKL
ncbi:hypothetical protein [Azospirillum griseum]|uniref:DUF4139 domain-containing protein n=1 Tax=Azospirillum griseum TaxID=2496639 RepID=A0A3S0HXB3_9PROT|nr:hypothetical protein [Azospirillum griseum]RTR19900.1 hypothetical protein EJ903_12995 [Azospirillum griseum]